MLQKQEKNSQFGKTVTRKPNSPGTRAAFGSNTNDRSAQAGDFFANGAKRRKKKSHVGSEHQKQ